MKAPRVVSQRGNPPKGRQRASLRQRENVQTLVNMVLLLLWAPARDYAFDVVPPVISLETARRRATWSEEAGVDMVADCTGDTVFNLADDDDESADDAAVQDGGAASVLGSARQIRKYLLFLLERGMDIYTIPLFACEKQFKYGNSVRETTSRCILLPFFLGKRRIDVLTYVIRATHPFLLEGHF